MSAAAFVLVYEALVFPLLVGCVLMRNTLKAVAYFRRVSHAPADALADSE